MKTKLIFVMIFVLILASACATQVQVTQPAEKTVVKDPVKPDVSVQPVFPVPKNIPSEIRELFVKAETRAESASYLYQGPETGNDISQFYVKGDKIRHIPSRNLKSLDKPESFDSIFIDKAAKTAKSYCVDPTCKYKGLKAELDYEAYYVPTIFDWADFNSAEKITEEQIERRATWVVKTDKGTLWIDTYYGVPLKVDADGAIYKYQQVNFNAVKDSDVNP
ncbi:MAG: hypothetical protein AABX00_00275 [Nanoarchaeota archaeon]